MGEDGLGGLCAGAWLEGARRGECGRWVYGADVAEGGGEVGVAAVEVDCCVG